MKGLLSSLAVLLALTGCDLPMVSQLNSPKDPANGGTANVPAVPTGVSASGGNGSVTLSWTAVSGASSYNVYRSTSSGFAIAPSNKIASSTTNAYTDSSVTNGTTYYYLVTALNNNGESACSAQVSALPQVGASMVPTGLSATAGSASVALTWTPVSGASSYNVYRSTTSGFTISPSYKLGTSTTTAYTDTKVTNGTPYYYLITAVNLAGESAPSTQVSALPSLGPTGLAATVGNGQVTLTWNSFAGASSYNLYWSTASNLTMANGTKVNFVASPFVESSLTNMTTYYFAVSAVVGTTETAISAVVSATPVPGAPTGLTVSVGTGQLKLSWQPVAGVTGYNLYYSTAASPTRSNSTQVQNVTSPYYQTSLVNGTTYYFFVTGTMNSGGLEFADSGIVSGTPNAPSSLAYIKWGAQGATPYWPNNYSEQFRFPSQSSIEINGIYNYSAFDTNINLNLAVEGDHQYYSNYEATVARQGNTLFVTLVNHQNGTGLDSVYLIDLSQSGLSTFMNPSQFQPFASGVYPWNGTQGSLYPYTGLNILWP